jgi:DNA-binding beta-propeller fold protein YncE
MAAVCRGAVVALLAVALGMLVGGCGGPGGNAPEAVAQLMDCGAKLGALDYPEGLGIGKTGDLLIADTWNHRIVRAGPNCDVVGAFGEAGGEPGKLECPRSLAVDRTGHIYVVDAWNHRVEKFDGNGRFLMSLGGQGGPWGNDEAEGKFSIPYGVAVDSQGHIFVSDFNNNRLQMFGIRGKFVMKWGTEGRQDGQFSHPAGLAIDSHDRLYVADLGNNRVQRFVIVEGDKGFEAKFDGKWGKEGREPGEFNGSYDVCVDKEDNVYVVDFWNHRIQKFTPGGDLIWVYGERGGEKGQFELPLSVAVDEEGAIYVSDWGNNRIQKLAPVS